MSFHIEMLLVLSSHTTMNYFCFIKKKEIMWEVCSGVMGYSKV